MNKEIKISIKNRWTGSILFEYSSVDNTLAKTVTEALKGGANLCDADLRDADLRDAYLCGVRGAYVACPTDGSFIGWKKASGYVVKLQIPENARRSSAGGEKCRCDKAYVVEIQNADGTKADIDTIHSNHDANFVYTVGATVEVSDFDGDRWNECTPGIHFFIDRRAAVEY